MCTLTFISDCELVALLEDDTGMEVCINQQNTKIRLQV